MNFPNKIRMQMRFILVAVHTCRGSHLSRFTLVAVHTCPVHNRRFTSVRFILVAVHNRRFILVAVHNRRFILVAVSKEEGRTIHTVNDVFMHFVRFGWVQRRVLAFVYCFSFLLGVLFYSFTPLGHCKNKDENDPLYEVLVMRLSGLILGVPLVSLSKACGRKVALCIAMVVMYIGATMFLLKELISIVFHKVIFSAGYVASHSLLLIWAIESLAPWQRIYVGVFYTAGTIAGMSCMAMGEIDKKVFVGFGFAFSILTIIFFIIYAHDSPPSMITRNRVKQLVAYLKACEYKYGNLKPNSNKEENYIGATRRRRHVQVSPYHLIEDVLYGEEVPSAWNVLISTFRYARFFSSFAIAVLILGMTFAAENSAIAVFHMRIRGKGCSVFTSAAGMPAILITLMLARVQRRRSAMIFITVVVIPALAFFSLTTSRYVGCFEAFLPRIEIGFEIIFYASYIISFVFLQSLTAVAIVYMVESTPFRSRSLLVAFSEVVRTGLSLAFSYHVIERESRTRVPGFALMASALALSIPAMLLIRMCESGGFPLPVYYYDVDDKLKSVFFEKVVKQCRGIDIANSDSDREEEKPKKSEPRATSPLPKGK